MANNNLSHLHDYYNHRGTELAKSSVWADGTPVPWLTYPAISYLNQLSFSGKSVFEYGCGASTAYWSARCRNLVSVENNEHWFNTVRSIGYPNAEIFFASGEEYVNKIRYRSPHDVIVIDGRWRFDCAMACVPHLAHGGLIILDNSERHPPINEYFRRKGLIQIDMIGYGPQNRNIWCTSLFLSRDFNFAPAKSIQPHHGPGMSDSIEVMPKYEDGNKPGALL